MNKFIFFLLLIISTSNLYAADVNLSYTIQSDKVDEYVNDYIYIHENNEMKDDPAWVDPGDGSDAPQVAKYTDKQWVREHIFRLIKRQIKRGNDAKYRDAKPGFSADGVTGVLS